MVHSWIPNSSPKVRDELLRGLGVKEVSELFNDIPPQLLLSRDLNVGFGRTLSEYEVRRLFTSLISKNRLGDVPSFIGGGVCQHYVPAVVKALISRSEFYTSYTPYQAEIAQGLLQAFFEYQSLMANLYGVKIVNASMYNGSTASAEAALMAVRVKRRRKILVGGSVHPEILDVIRTWGFGAGLELVRVELDRESGQIDLSDLESKLSDEVAAVFIQSPNFFGVIESGVREVIDEAHRVNALSIIYSHPLTLGLLEAPGNLGADIVVGDVQGLGVGLNFGGPSAGVLGINDDKELLRQFPGRLIGATRTLDGKDLGFAMILQTREQHIKREKATSNITTNAALEALAAAAYVSLLGAQGLRELGEAILGRTNYLVKRLKEVDSLDLLFPRGLHFREVGVRFRSADVVSVIKSLTGKGLQIGPHLGRFYRELSDCSLMCVTELHTRGDIELLISSLKNVLGGGA
ncbi:MAG: aminomethyl-transferring glycine dehydrogenase subunit GcvPA [Zestosphaera sp.]